MSWFVYTTRPCEWVVGGWIPLDWITVQNLLSVLPHQGKYGLPSSATCISLTTLSMVA